MTHMVGLFTMMVALLLNGCSSVTVKDEIFYGNKGMVGAVEFHLLTTDKATLSFEQWMQLIRTQPLVCTSVNNLGDLKAEIEKLCSVCNCCTYATTAAVEQFATRAKIATAK